MRLNNFLNTVCDNIKYAPVRETIKTELKEHIIEEKQNYIDNGMNDLEAEQKAISNMGSPDQISQSFNKIYRKKLDWKLLLIFIILTAINILLFVSISMKQNNDISYIVRNISYIFTIDKGRYNVANNESILSCLPERSFKLWIIYKYDNILI